MKKRSEISVEEATLKAFNIVSDVFYLNSIENAVHAMLSPFRPMTTSISDKMRKLRKKGKINYHANEVGLYEKIY